MAIVACGVQRCDVVDLDPVDVLQYQDTAGGVVPVDLGDVETRLVGEVGAEAVGVASFPVEVQFGSQGSGKFLGDLRQIV